MCRSACAADGRCLAYSYVKPGAQFPKAHCWLKSTVPPRSSHWCCVSGVKGSASSQTTDKMGPRKPSQGRHPGWLGLSVQAVTPDIAEALGMKAPNGALIAQTVDGGPGAKAGLKAGDVIVAVNGEPINT